jgi:hypothetical protein
MNREHMCSRPQKVPKCSPFRRATVTAIAKACVTVCTGMRDSSNVDMPSITGGVTMLAGGVIDALSQRQHTVSPDAHTSEVVAAGTCLHRVIAIRGILQELRIPQVTPTPLYVDSISTSFVANDTGSVKRSMHVLPASHSSPHRCER